MILSKNILKYLKEGKTLEEACAKAGVVQNELNIWKLWADKGLQPYADFFREIQNYKWIKQDMKINCNLKKILKIKFKEYKNNIKKFKNNLKKVKRKFI